MAWTMIVPLESSRHTARFEHHQAYIGIGLLGLTSGYRGGLLFWADESVYPIFD